METWEYWKKDSERLKVEMQKLMDAHQALAIVGDALLEKVIKSERELEIERLRLVSCGTAALGYLKGCRDEYKSASLDDVLRLLEGSRKWEKRCLRLLECDDLVLEVNEYGPGASGNSMVSIDDLEDIDSVIERETRPRPRRSRDLPPAAIERLRGGRAIQGDDFRRMLLRSPRARLLHSDLGTRGAADPSGLDRGRRLSSPVRWRGSAPETVASAVLALRRADRGLRQ